MKLPLSGPLLSTIFVDYDDIYLSLKRKSEEAAKRFSKDALLWLRELESGRLIRRANPGGVEAERRIVMSRCYGSPAPRRNAHDNATDMGSFPFVRHHFLASGFEVVDCLPLNQQITNSTDIRLVMDVRDTLDHETEFGEFIFFAGDADLTPVLHRLRAHARRTVLFTSDHTVAPYRAISDGEVREDDLIAFLIEGRLPAPASAAVLSEQQPAIMTPLELARKLIVSETVATVRAVGQPMATDALADRLVRVLGPEKTIGSGWGGAGSLRELLVQELSEPMRISGEAPFIVFEAPSRPVALEPNGHESRRDRPGPGGPAHGGPLSAGLIGAQPEMGALGNGLRPRPNLPAMNDRLAGDPGGAARPSEGATALQKSIARIHNACKAPPLSPPDYQVLFETMAGEINANGINGPQTVANIAARSKDATGVQFQREDIRFVLEVVSEPDPWFDQGASANIFAGRFRNFVVARCRAKGLTLSAEELELIEAWFAGPAAGGRPTNGEQRGLGHPNHDSAMQAGRSAAGSAPNGRWWNLGDGQSERGPAPTASYDTGAQSSDEFPRIVRRGLRG